jgi:hypothetical protein
MELSNIQFLDFQTGRKYGKLPMVAYIRTGFRRLKRMIADLFSPDPNTCWPFAKNGGIY